MLIETIKSEEKVMNLRKSQEKFAIRDNREGLYRKRKKQYREKENYLRERKREMKRKEKR